MLSLLSRRVLALCVFVCLGSTLASCVGYAVYPPEPGEHGFTNPNSDPFPGVMKAALRWTVLRYPPNASTEFSAAAPAGPEGPFAINLPQGVTPLLAHAIARDVGYGARPLTPGNEHLPIYHVARIWISGDEAQVDIVRPVLRVPVGIPAATTLQTGAGTVQAPAEAGKVATQGITLRLRGGVHNWEVSSHRVWSFNAMPVPALNFVQPVPGPNQYGGEPQTGDEKAPGGAGAPPADGAPQPGEEDTGETSK